MIHLKSAINSSCHNMGDDVSLGLQVVLALMTRHSLPPHVQLEGSHVRHDPNEQGRLKGQEGQCHEMRNRLTFPSILWIKLRTIPSVSLISFLRPKFKS